MKTIDQITERQSGVENVFDQNDFAALQRLIQVFDDFDLAGFAVGFVPKERKLPSFEAQQEGDLLIACGDMNQDVLSPEIQGYFSSLNLRHLIFSRHDSSLAPATMS